MNDTPRAIRVHKLTRVYACAMENESCERTAREAREHFADMINDAIQGRITYITSHGRRVAAVVPLAEITGKVPVDDHEYDEGYEAARSGDDYAPSEVAAKSASWQLGYRASKAAAKSGDAK